MNQAESQIAAATASHAGEGERTVMSARRLTKCYGRGDARSDALIGVDLDVREGEIVGVLGPNGAGKTTLVSILEGVIEADSGTAMVLGEDVRDPDALTRIKPRLGISMQHGVLPPLLKVVELLEFKRALYPVSRDTDELLERLGLETKRGAQYRHLSGGQQQRVVLAMALVGDPELMFLDEPTSQLDPQARRIVWDMLMEQRQRRNAGILVTTHQMEEAERFCDRVLILDHGKVIASGTPRTLIAAHCPERFLEFATSPQQDLTFLPTAEVGEPRGDGLMAVRIRDASLDAVLSDLLRRHGSGELVLEELRVTSQTLEDVFIALTGRGIRA